VDVMQHLHKGTVHQCCYGTTQLGIPADLLEKAATSLALSAHPTGIGQSLSSPIHQDPIVKAVLPVGGL